MSGVKGAAVVNKLVWLFHGLVGVCIVGAGLLANSALNEYSGLLSVLGLGIGYYSTVLNYHYNHDPAVYAFVNRALLRIRRDHTYWELSLAFSFEPKSPPEREELLSDLEAKLRAAGIGAITVPIKAFGRMEVTIDHLIGLEFRLEPCRLAVNFDRRLTVPIHAYADYQKLLLDLSDAIQSAFVADEMTCDVQVFFRKNKINPFYGYFLNRIPAKMLETFHVVFRLDRCPDCRLEASQDHLGVQATSLPKLFAGLDEVLSYRAMSSLTEAP